MAEDLYKVPNQIEFDGIKYTGGQHSEVLTKIRNELELTKDDILSVSYPKTGSTWVNEILLLIKLDVDEEKWRNIPRFERFPYIEMDPPMMARGHTYDKLDNAPPPRLVKSHLPVDFFTRHLHEEGPRIVVPMRNPKSTLVSFYHFYRANRALGCFTGTWDEFFHLFEHDGLVYGKPTNHFADWWIQRNHSNVFIIKYEELHKNTEQVVRNLVKFLGKSFSDQQIDDIIRLSSFDSLREKAKDFDKMLAQSENMPRPMGIDQKISPFFRKGSISDWKNYFSDKQNTFIEKDILEMYEKSGLEFEYE